MTRTMVAAFAVILMAWSGTAMAQDIDNGPVGGRGGRPFRDVAPRGTKLVRVTVWHGRVIDAIQLVYKTRQGQEVKLPKRGGPGGTREDVVDIATALTGVSGRYGTLIDSLVFEVADGVRLGETKLARMGERGGESAYRFEAPPGYEIVGFFGRSGKSLDALGVVVRRK